MHLFCISSGEMRKAPYPISIIAQRGRSEVVVLSSLRPRSTWQSNPHQCNAVCLEKSKQALLNPSLSEIAFCTEGDINC